MVLPTKELPSTLNLTPFRVLTPEEDEGLLVVGRSRRGGAPTKMIQMIHDKNKDEQQQQKQQKQPHNNSHYQHHQSKRSRKSYPDEHFHLDDHAPVLQVSDSNSSSGSSSSSGQEDSLERLPGTTTLLEERSQQNKENATSQYKRQSSNSYNNGTNGRNNNNNYKNPVDNNNHHIASFEGVSTERNNNNKILNLLNAQNASFISSTTSSKISEDELFTDLKSRFIEKHFRTILRSQNSICTLPSKGNRVGVISVNEGSGQHILTGSNNRAADITKFDSSGPGIKGKDDCGEVNTIFKPIKIITVDRPEPQLDLPRVSYFKSTKKKFFKMHEQAKTHVLERYRKLCEGMRANVLPHLYPLQVFVEVILSNLFVLVTAPFAIVATILLCFVRLCIGLVLKIRYKGRYQLMSGSDAAWAYQAYANDSSFLSLYVIQGDCSISRIRDRIMKSVINCQDPQYPGKLTYSRLRCRIIEKFGFYCWETLHPMDFCIDDHVRYITNDPGAVLTQEQVLQEIQKFIDQPSPDQLWQILVVPKFLYSKEHDHYAQEDNLEDDGFGNFDTITVKKKPNNKLYTGNHYYALVWRINHALMDGISAANCLQHCIADMPVKLTIDPLQSLNISWGLKLVMYFKMMFFGSRSLLKSMLQRDLNCFHGPGLTGPKTLSWSRGINLNAVKAIRKKNDGTTTTAVLAAAVGGSLRGLALRKNNPIPSKIRAGVTCALLPYPNIKPQNRFTVAHLRLKLDLESHKERLLFASKSARELIRSADIFKNYGLIRLVGLMPKKVIPWFMDNCEATVLISNIPGPMEEYTIFQGQKLVDIIGWNTIKGNTAIGVCLFSYAGRIRAGVIADGAVLPSSTDVPSLIEEFEKDMVNLAKDADVKEKDVFMEAL